jgi:hypothetical protein
MLLQLVLGFVLGGDVLPTSLRSFGRVKVFAIRGFLDSTALRDDVGI